jgi:internalin A
MGMYMDSTPVELFYSYAHADEAYRLTLEKHLKLLQRQGVISAWHDRKIMPGALWSEDVHHYLERAHIILLLISPDFIASDYCYDIEMKRALERHRTGSARVVPVALRPVDHCDAPFMHLQGLPDGFRPISEWDNQDRAFAAVAQGIRILAQALHIRPALPR